MGLEKRHSKCSAENLEFNELLAIVDPSQASTLEVREARSKLLRQIMRGRDQNRGQNIEEVLLKEASNGDQ